MPESFSVPAPDGRPADDYHDQLAGPTGAFTEPIAIIGIGCRFPGDADSPEAFWQLLADGRDAVAEIPPQRWDVAAVYDPEPGVPGRTVSRWGGMLDEVDGFDAEFFGITTREAEAMDPQHRLLLQTAWEALEHAGLDPGGLAGSRTGVFAGMSYHDYMLQTMAESGTNPYVMTGNAFSVASGRISYLLGLHGPSVTIDTACSSALVAVHLAAQGLLAGDCDLALAGGVSLILGSEGAIAFSGWGMLSPDGQCRAFDASANGFVRSEGCGIVALERLSDAQRAGHRVLAVIRGSATNSDGRSNGLTAPNARAQEAVQRQALRAAGVDPTRVGLVEAHGTGTPVGDPIEFSGLNAVYGSGDGRCALGSVKTNIGHTEPASGAAGLIKTVMALRHGQVPANLHFDGWNPDIDHIGSRLFVPTSTTAWPVADGPRLAAVSSYGFSGTNAHVVLEQAPEPSTAARALAAVPSQPARSSPRPAGPGATEAGPRVFCLSATSPDALAATAGRLADWLETAGRDVALADVGYTLARRRARRPVGLGVVAASTEELLARLRTAARGELGAGMVNGRDRSGTDGAGRRGPVFVFSGQGSQWAGMGLGLAESSPAFAAVLDELEPLILAESGFSLREALAAPEVVTGIDRVQPTLFAMQVGLAAAWAERGVVPAAVIGHSMGEAAAAVVSGALSLADGARVICRRSRLMARLAGAGAMASVELSRAELEAELAAAAIDDVVVAVVSSPSSSVVAGDPARVAGLVAGWQERDLMARAVAVDVASHSAHVDPILDEIAEALASLEPREQRLPCYGTVLDDPSRPPPFDAGYWVANLRNPVRFADAVGAALTDGHRVFVEVAPHPLLTHAIGQTASHLGRDAVALPTVRRGEDEQLGLLSQVAAAHCAGAEVDWTRAYPTGSLVDAPLPAWEHPRLVILAPDGPGGHAVAAHPLLGVHVRVPDVEGAHIWQADLGTAALPWLADHRVHGVAVLPGAAYCSMALAAAAELFDTGDALTGVEASGVDFEQVLFLDDHTTLSATATPRGPDEARFEVVARGDEGEPVRHAVATLRRAAAGAGAGAAGTVPEPVDVEALVGEHGTSVDPEEFYRSLRAMGIYHGPAFAGVSEIRTGDVDTQTVLGTVTVAPELRADAAAFGLHPVLLDACLQTLAAHPRLTPKGSGPTLALPLGVGAIRVFADPARTRYCLARLLHAGDREASGDLRLLAEDGTVVAEVAAVRLVASADRTPERIFAERLLVIGWDEVDCGEPADEPVGSWLVVTETVAESTTDGNPAGGNAAGEPAASLADTLRERGGACETLAVPLTAAGDDELAAAIERRLAVGGWRGLVLVCPPASPTVDEATLDRAQARVRRLIRTTRALVENAVGAVPRLWIVTRDAQPVLAQRSATPTVPAGNLSALATADTPGAVAAPTMDGGNLEQSALRGLCRVVGYEHAELGITLVDLDAASGTAELTRELLSGRTEDEVGWRDGHRYVAHLRNIGMRDDERHTAAVDLAADGVAVRIRQPGDLGSFELAVRPRQAPGPGEVEIKVRAASLNYADVLNAMGLYKTVDATPVPLGVDCAGVVCAVGPGVTDVDLGDRVATVQPGALGSFVTVAAEHLLRLPDNVSQQAGAGIPATFATAWYGLRQLADLSVGERVLIHSASGGVGLAAIGIARAVGAEVFATAGSDEKRAYLRELGIEHVMDSRSLDFADQIREITGGEGIDVVLNSLVGPAQQAGLDLLRTGGRFIELGKLDIYSHTRLDLFPFRRNITFSSVDLGLIRETRPKLSAKMLDEIGDELSSGRLTAPPHTAYELADTSTAFRTLAAGRHIGKLVIDVPQHGTATAVVPPSEVPVVRPDGAYLVTGGLGGLGLLLARWLAQAGAGRIVLTGRSAPTEYAESVIAELRAAGSDVVVVLGDVADDQTAGRLVAAATATGCALRGILHGAAVVKDAAVTMISDELLDRVWRPKVLGAWRLHQASRGHELDWWFGFSSGAGMLGFPGQGAYAAANSWLDGFTTWRRTTGLPAISTSWGAWADHGLGASFEDRGYAMITPEEGIEACERLLRHDRPRSGYVPIHEPGWLKMLGHALNASFFEVLIAEREHKQSGDGGPDSAVLADLSAADPSARQAILEDYLATQAGTILRMDRTAIDPDRPLMEIGIDSLMALELRTRVEKDLGVRVPTKVLWSHGSPAALASYLGGRLWPDAAASAGSSGSNGSNGSNGSTGSASSTGSADSAADDRVELPAPGLPVDADTPAAKEVETVAAG